MPVEPAVSANPFRYGALALDETFTDRVAEITELLADLRNGQDVLIVAPRRLGKSSLVWRVRQEAIRSGVLVAHVDLMTAPTKARLAEKLARTIHEDIASRVYRARERALGVFRGLRVAPRITVNPDDGSLAFGFDVGHDAPDLDATIERLLELPAVLGAERRRTVALVLDEFQEVVEIDPRLPRLMRAVFQRQPEVAHVYLGSRRHMLARIFNDANEPFWRSAKQLELGPIEPGVFARFVAERFDASGKRIEPDAASGLLELTGGHPYATQELAYFTWEETALGATAAAVEVERGLVGVLRSEHAHFSLLWERASPTQRLVLEALAHEAGRPYTNDYRRRHRLPPATNVQKALTALARQELVARERAGVYRIAEPFLAEWIVRTVSAARPA